MAEELRLQITATSGNILDPATALIASMLPLSIYTRKRALGENVLTDNTPWQVSLQGAQDVAVLIIQTNSPILVTVTPITGGPATVPVSDMLVLSSRVNRITAVEITRDNPNETTVTAILLEQAP